MELNRDKLAFNCILLVQNYRKYRFDNYFLEIYVLNQNYSFTQKHDYIKKGFFFNILGPLTYNTVQCDVETATVLWAKAYKRIDWERDQCIPTLSTRIWMKNVLSLEMFINTGDVRHDLLPIGTLLVDHVLNIQRGRDAHGLRGREGHWEVGPLVVRRQRGVRHAALAQVRV